MTNKSVLITGVSGQDGHYLAQQAASRGYAISGTSRAGNAIAGPLPIDVHRCDLLRDDEIEAIVDRVRPQLIFNMAAYATGSGMFNDPTAMGEINGLTATRLLEAVRRVDPSIRLCQASSSEMYGDRSPAPQNEDTPFHPRSPYGAAKLYAHSMIDVYRERYGLFACSAILFNHESPLRPLNFVTRKVTNAAAQIKLGLTKELTLGNLEIRRDWGYAGDAARAMWMMLEADRPRDYVVATGKTHSLRDLCQLAFERVDLDYREFVRSEAALVRPREANELVGDAGRLNAELGWSPEVSFSDMIHAMVDADLAALRMHTN